MGGWVILFFSPKAKPFLHLQHIVRIPVEHDDLGGSTGDLDLGIQCSEFVEGNSRVDEISSSSVNLFHPHVRRIPTENDDMTSTEELKYPVQCTEDNKTYTVPTGIVPQGVLRAADLRNKRVWA
ncbi:hypothetical protein ACROYT_G028041 [Oculina patagonica]